ncbi:MAG: hypothetical protein WCI41_01375 [bacterium]
MQKIRKIYIASLVITIIFAGVFFLFNKPILKVEASATDSSGFTKKLYGYAWSPNVGWISFNNCTNPLDSSTCAGGQSYDVFFVPVDGGYLQGNAWAPNVGWIDFGSNSGSTASSGFPDGSGQAGLAKIDISTGKLSGWARIKSMSANANDGWISLNDVSASPKYGVQFNPTDGSIYSLSAATKHYAWNSDLFGWIDFFGVKIETIPGPVVTLSSSPDSLSSAQVVYQGTTYIRAGIDIADLSWTGNHINSFYSPQCTTTSSWNLGDGTPVVSTGNDPWDGTKNYSSTPSSNVFSFRANNTSGNYPESVSFGMKCKGEDNTTYSPISNTSVMVCRADACMDSTKPGFCYNSDTQCDIPPSGGEITLEGYCKDTTSTQGYVVFKSTNLAAGSSCTPSGLPWNSIPSALPASTSLVNNGSYEVTCLGVTSNKIVLNCPGSNPPCTGSGCVGYKKTPKYIER